MSAQQPAVGFISLGCPKATVDSERILTKLRADGYAIVPSYEEADLVIVNTCGFIDSAVQESLDTIGEALQENGKVIVTGCLSAREGIVETAYPNVLAVSGAQAYETVMKQVHEFLPIEHKPFESLVPPEGIKLTPRHYSYLKISEGCNHRCTFCIIPSMRGDLVSRSIADVVEEAKRLVDAGVKELLVVSQDTSAYGVDVKHKMEFWNGRPLKNNMVDLCKALAELKVWVRLHYVYPYPNVDEVIPLMAEGKILPYLDIPFQHASPRVLKNMKRPGSAVNLLERIQKWREICPDLTIRSTFIVGFPGETDDEFEELITFLKAAQLDRVGCFQYSPVEGAKANELGLEQISEDVKQARYDRFMQVQAEISAARLQAKIGKQLLVIIDEVDEDGAIGRSMGDAPEIDGVVYLEDEIDLSPGDIVTVEVEDSDAYDLWGRLVRG
jgi:ribosomal protein S12 methylthiotransferase